MRSRKVVIQMTDGRVRWGAEEVRCRGGPKACVVESGDTDRGQGLEMHRGSVSVFNAIESGQTIDAWRCRRANSKWSDWNSK